MRRQIYFLSDKKNPTRAVLDFTDVSDTARGLRLVSTLRERGINVIVINHDPSSRTATHPLVIRRLGTSIRWAKPWGTSR